MSNDHVENRPHVMPTDSANSAGVRFEASPTASMPSMGDQAHVTPPDALQHNSEGIALPRLYADFAAHLTTPASASRERAQPATETVPLLPDKPDMSTVSKVPIMSGLPALIESTTAESHRMHAEALLLCSSQALLHQLEAPLPVTSSLPALSALPLSLARPALPPVVTPAQSPAAPGVIQVQVLLGVDEHANLTAAVIGAATDAAQRVVHNMAWQRTALATAPSEG